MDKVRTTKLLSKKITLSVDHNPYEVVIYTPRKAILGKLIVMPIFNYQKDSQYVDLITPLVDRGYKLITVNLLNQGDMVLFFSYYFDVFKEILETLYSKKFFQKEELTIMGIGIGAYLASNMNFYHNDQIKVSKIVLISPVNRYKSEYRISGEIENFLTPTYIFFGQLDTVNDINSRYSIFKSGKDNPNVHFFSYPVTGHYLYYSATTSRDLENIYHSSGFDLLVGETRQDKIPFLPSEVVFNEVFFKHLFNIIDNRTNRRKIALITDAFPLFTNGVGWEAELLRDELEKLGYDTYLVALWKKGEDFANLPTAYHIPIVSSLTKGIKGYDDWMAFRVFHTQRKAKMLAMFGFDYIHLMSDYSMSVIALELAKITNIKMLYTEHNNWKMYYDFKVGKLAKDLSVKNIKKLSLNRVFKECPTVLVPSQKSYEILKMETDGKKDLRILPSAIDTELFTLSKEDRTKVRRLKIKYKIEDKKILGFVNHISTEKNVNEVINYVSRVVKEIPNIVLMIICDASVTERLQKYARKLHIEDYLVFVNDVRTSELKYYYALFDVFVSASSFETQSASYFEAASTGSIILAKEDKALEGIFEDGKNCYIYNDFYQWVEKLEKALFSDSKKIGDSAKLTARKYSQEKWAKQVSKFYTELNDKK